MIIEEGEEEGMREEGSPSSRNASKRGGSGRCRRGGSIEPCYSRPPPPNRGQSHPWLLICHGQEGYRQTFYDLHEDRYYTKCIAQMRKRYVYPTNISGWLVLEDEDTLECFLWNMISFDIIKIPSLGDDQTSKFLLTCHPQDEQDCYVALITKEHTVRFCKLGEEEFQQSKILGYDGYLVDITVFKGVIYLLALDCILFEVKICATSCLQFTRLTWEQVLSDLLPKNLQCFELYLIGYEDELLLVIELSSISASYRNFSFFIFRMNFSSGTWERVKGIGERTLFLSKAISYACTPGDHRVKNNSIYVPWGGRSLRLFDMEDQSTSTLVPCPIASRRTSDVFWVMF